MKPMEPLVDRDRSEFFVSSPSLETRRDYLYPLRAGTFLYEAGYALERASFDSFLVLYVKRGELHLRYGDACTDAVRGEHTAHAGHAVHAEYSVHAGQYALVDCHGAHAYRAPVASEVIWLHLDGMGASSLAARATRKGPVITPREPERALRALTDACRALRPGAAPSDARMHALLTNLLVELIDDAEAPRESNQASEPIRQIAAYMTDHLSENLSVAQLAQRACMSVPHFIRLFKEQMGVTPHRYLTNARMDTARYLLASTEVPILNVARTCGFHDASVFSSAFRRAVGTSPRAFREHCSLGTGSFRFSPSALCSLGTGSFRFSPSTLKAAPEAPERDCEQKAGRSVPDERPA